jgi:hypothetical protein
VTGCIECRNTGYLLGQSYGYSEIPDGWTPVQACATCLLLDDEKAAEDAARELGTTARYFEDPNVDDDEDWMGEWAIKWEADQ